jgi:hypothetical protein
MTLTKQNILNYREKLVRELKAIDLTLSIFQGEPKESKRKSILNEVKKSRKSKFTKAQRKAMSLRMKDLWKKGKLGKK